MGNAPRLLAYLTIILPFVFSFSIWAIIPCIVASLVAKELMLLSVACILLIWKLKKVNYRIYAIISIVPILYLLHDKIWHALVIRWNVWEPVLVRFFQRPLIGYGLGVLPYADKKLIAYHDTAIYSSFLQFIIGAGVLGAIWLGYVLWKFAKTKQFGIETMAVLAIILLSVLEHPFEIPRLWLTMTAIIGFYMIKEIECG